MNTFILTILGNNFIIYTPTHTQKEREISSNYWNLFPISLLKLRPLSTRITKQNKAPFINFPPPQLPSLCYFLPIHGGEVEPSHTFPLSIPTVMLVHMHVQHHLNVPQTSSYCSSVTDRSYAHVSELLVHLYYMLRYFAFLYFCHVYVILHWQILILNMTKASNIKVRCMQK